MADLNVVCLKWGNLYSPEYVNNLFYAVKKHLSVEHRFICMTENGTGLDKDIETKPLVEKMVGWWHKLTLFKEKVYDLQGQILFFDLDMVIIRSIDEIAQYGNPDGFYALPEPTWHGEFGTAILRFNIGEHARIWYEFEKRKEEVIKNTWGDQNWIMAISLPIKDGQGRYTRANQRRYGYLVPNRPLIYSLPREWFQSLKKDLSKTFPKWQDDLEKQECRISDKCKIIVFHGHPRPHEIMWIRKYWNVYAKN